MHEIDNLEPYPIKPWPSVTTPLSALTASYRKLSSNNRSASNRSIFVANAQRREYRQCAQQSHPNVDHQRRCEPCGDDPLARSRAPLTPHARPGPQPSSRAPAIRRSPRRLCKPVQDPYALGVTDTAPYFHDKGAKTLRNAVAHYQRSFNFTDAQDLVGSRSLGGLITLTDNDVDDIVAYLKLLGPNRIDK